jgi:phospholipase A1
MVLLVQTAWAQTAEELQDCMVKQMTLAPGDTTINQLRNQCAALLADRAGPVGKAALDKLDTDVRPEDLPPDDDVEPTAPERRFGSEIAILDNPFAITAHRPNYWLLAAYNSNTNEEPFEREFERDVNVDHVESKFQISLKFPLARGLFDGRVNVMGAYTNRSFWQLYNSDSAPFRETNHEPELWVSLLNDSKIFGWRNAANNFGFNHQSNGRGGDFLSRSWNRIFAKFIFEKDDQILWVKPWLRIPEDDDDDDNPDIEDYLGYGEVGWSWAVKGHTVSAMLRNHLASGFSRGATTLSWSFPIPHYNHFRGYVQVFSGYGESLIDYDKYNNSIGIGFSLTDWLR